MTTEEFVVYRLGHPARHGDLTKLHALPFIVQPDEEREYSYSEQRVLTGIR